MLQRLGQQNSNRNRLLWQCTTSTAGGREVSPLQEWGWKSKLSQWILAILATGMVHHPDVLTIHLDKPSEIFPIVLLWGRTSHHFPKKHVRCWRKEPSWEVRFDWVWTALWVKTLTYSHLWDAQRFCCSDVGVTAALWTQSGPAKCQWPALWALLCKTIVAKQRQSDAL